VKEAISSNSCTFLGHVLILHFWQFAAKVHIAIWEAKLTSDSFDEMASADSEPSVIPSCNSCPAQCLCMHQELSFTVNIRKIHVKIREIHNVVVKGAVTMFLIDFAAGCLKNTWTLR
jgi:hypothetical protein